MFVRSKKLILLGVFFITSVISFSQVTGDCKTIASGPWSTLTNWQRWNGTTWMTPVAVPSATDNIIRVLHAMTLTASVTVNQDTICSGGSITINSGVILTVSNGIVPAAAIDLTIKSGGSITNNGTITMSASSTTSNSGTIINSGVITPVGLTHASGGLYQHNFSGSVGTIPVSTWAAGSKCEILACGTGTTGPTGLNQIFSDFTWNYTGQTTAINLAGVLTTTSIGRDFTMLSTGTGTLTLKTSAGALTTTVGRNFLISGGALILTNGAVGNAFSNLTFNIQGTYTQTGGILIISANTGALLTTNGWGAISVTGVTNISGGTLTFTTSTSSSSSQGYGTFTSSGAMTISGGTVNLSESSGGGTGGYGSLTVNSTLTISGGIVNLSNSSRTGGGGNGTINSTGLMTLSGGTINGTTLNGNGTINANAGLTMISGSLNLSNSTSVAGGGNGTLNVTGAFAISGGTFNLNTSTAAGTVAGNVTVTITGTLAISGTAVVNLTSSSTTGGGGNGTIAVSGNFTMTAGTLNLASGSGAGTGTDGLLDIEGTCSFSGGTLDLSSSSRTGGGGNGTISVAGASFSHTTIAASFSKTGAATTGTINIDGIVAQTIESTNGFSGTPIVFNIDQGGTTAKTTIPAAKTFIVNAGTTLNINDNSLNTGYDLQVVSTGILQVSGIMNINTLATLDLLAYAITDASTGAGTFNLTTDATLITKHAEGITTLATGAFGCIRVTGARNYSSNASYTYNANATSQVTGNGLPTSLFLPSILTINNTCIPLVSNGVTLTQATTTDGTLTLTAGRFITTSANLITLNDGAISSSSGSISAFVDGPIKKIGNTLFIFPTGDVYTATGSVFTAKWARIEIAAPSSTTDAYIAEYHKLNDPCDVNQAVSNVNGAGIDHVSYKEYWDLARTAGTSTPQVKLYWPNGAVSTSIGSAISSILATNLHVAEFYSGQWNDKGAGTITGTTAAGTIQNAVALPPSFTSTAAMQFTFSAPTSVNPLPIELLSFTGYSALNGNQLNWSTATEINNDHFDIERSADGMIFNTIGTINGNGNSTSIIEYDHLDASPFSGISYYRLKQVDYNGDYSNSNIIAVDRRSLDNISVQVYPNPTSDIINIISSESVSSVFIYNMLGELVYESAKEEHNITFNPLAKGIYVVKATSNEGKESMIRFIKK